MQTATLLKILHNTLTHAPAYCAIWLKTKKSNPLWSISLEKNSVSGPQTHANVAQTTLKKLLLYLTGPTRRFYLPIMVARPKSSLCQTRSLIQRPAGSLTAPLYADDLNKNLLTPKRALKSQASPTKA